MADLNWNALFTDTRPPWSATRGAGIRIAVLDSGADLEREALAHLDRPGHRFDVARPDFSLTDPVPAGNDAVRGVDAHGTHLLTALAGATEGDGPRGLAPDAEVYIVKIASANGLVIQQYFLDGLALALSLDVDLVVTGQSPMVIRQRSVPDLTAKSAALFARLAAQHIGFVCPAFATLRPDQLGRFPADRAEAIVAAAPPATLLAAPGGEKAVAAVVDFVLPRTVEVGEEKFECTHGLAAAAVGGLLALYLAHLRQSEGRAYRRRTRDELAAAVQALARPFSAAAVGGSRQLELFTTLPLPVV